MPNNRGTSSYEDKAWATFKTPLDKNSLLEFCQDIERLLRINPYLVFKKWEKIGEQLYYFHVVNHSQTPAFKIESNFKVCINTNGLEISYNQGLKSSTTFFVEAMSGGSKLTITENYRTLTEDERLTRLHEVDKSLIKWAKEIQAFLLRWQRWSWLPFWRYYMQHVWQPMNPIARRITYALLWISAFEVALVVLGAAIYFIEYR